MRLLRACAFVFIACEPASTVDPAVADASDSGPAVESGTDGSAADVATDVGADVAVGTPGFCDAQRKGASILVLGVTPSGGSSLYRVYPDSDWDQHEVDLVYNGNKLSVADIAHVGNVYRVTNGVAWWTIAAPLPTGTHELGPAIPNGPNGVPPTVAFVTPADPWIGRGGTTFTQLDVGTTVDFQAKGNVFGPGTACSSMRDFLSGSGANPTYTFLATCGTDPNSVVTATSTKDVNNVWTGTSSVATLPNSSGVQGEVLGVDKDVYLTATKIYVSGVFRRNIKVCLADGNLSAPIGGLRAAIP